MPTITEYYDYAKLATAAYVQLESVGTAGNKLAEATNAQSRLPTAIANLTFDIESIEAKASGLSVWTIPTRPNPNDPNGPRLTGYYGDDGTGFAATLFEKDGKKVLAIRGTEPPGIDLYRADIGEIGFMGFAVSQTVSMINLLLRLQAPTSTSTVRQWSYRFSETAPSPEELSIPIAGGRAYLKLATSNLSSEEVTTRCDQKKLDLAGPNDAATVTSKPSTPRTASAIAIPGRARSSGAWTRTRPM
jgi:hypothetical protein